MVAEPPTCLDLVLRIYSLRLFLTIHVYQDYSIFTN